MVSVRGMALVFLGSTVLARINVLLQYLSRSVAVAFGYGKCRASPSINCPSGKLWHSNSSEQSHQEALEGVEWEVMIQPGHSRKVHFELPAPNFFAPIVPVKYCGKTSHNNKTGGTNRKLVLGGKRKMNLKIIPREALTKNNRIKMVLSVSSGGSPGSI
jgi:hypothetical protein